MSRTRLDADPAPLQSRYTSGAHTAPAGELQCSADEVPPCSGVMSLESQALESTRKTKSSEEKDSQSAKTLYWC